MPTGYTADLYEGKAITFKEFALTAARGMGAAIMQRDDGPGPIADEYQPSTHYRDGYEKATKTLAELMALSLDEWARRQAVERLQIVSAERAASVKSDKLRASYEWMLTEVEAWKPPTIEHENFKKFMREQLETSIKFDCSPYPRYSHSKPIRPSVAEFRAAQIARAEGDITYHRKAWDEEQERTASRNKWVRDLKESLPTN